jgi:hypothetical protein
VTFPGKGVLFSNSSYFLSTFEKKREAGEAQTNERPINSSIITIPSQFLSGYGGKGLNLPGCRCNPTTD